MNSSRRNVRAVRRKALLLAAFETEMAAGKCLVQAGRLEDAMRHLERAHVLGQRAVMPHIRSHWSMLRIAIKRKSAAEGLGQVVRIILGALGSALGVVPTGNTGGTNISMFARLPLEPDIAALIVPDGHHSQLPVADILADERDGNAANRR